MVAVTSRSGKPASVGDVMIEEWREAGLLKVSLIKPVFATVEQTLIVRKLGALQQRDLAALRKALQEILG